MSSMRLALPSSWSTKASALAPPPTRIATWRRPRPPVLRSSGPARPRTVVTLAKKGDEGGKILPKELFDLAGELGKMGSELTGTAAAGRRPPPPAPRAASSNGGTGNGVYLLLLINFALFLAEQLFHPRWVSMLALNHWAPKWWQFVTAAFVHANWEHLSSNAFSLLIFGRIVEEEEGALGVWATYILCGVGGCVASYLTSPHTRTVSLGASAAVFGLFMVGVLTKFRPSLRRLLEAVILGQFVIKQVLNEVSMVAGGRAVTLAGMQVGHVAHLAGAAVGVALVLLLARLPDVGDD